MESIPLSSGKEEVMPKNRVPMQINNYMIFWIEKGAPQYVEVIGREAALSLFKLVRKSHKDTCRMYRMVIDGHEEI